MLEQTLNVNAATKKKKRRISAGDTRGGGEATRLTSVKSKRSQPASTHSILYNFPLDIKNTYSCNMHSSVHQLMVQSAAGVA